MGRRNVSLLAMGQGGEHNPLELLESPTSAISLVFGSPKTPPRCCPSGRAARRRRCNAPCARARRETQEAAAQVEHTAGAACCCRPGGLPAAPAAGAAPAHAGRAEREDVGDRARARRHRARVAVAQH